MENVTSRYDDFDHLSKELENEAKYSHDVSDKNVDLESNVSELEDYLHRMEEKSKQADDIEWKVRYESYTARNFLLSEEKNELEQALAETKWKTHTDQYPDVMNYNIDLLTEMELVRLVKHMEQLRNECSNSLRDAEYKTDITVREFRKFDEIRKAFRAELKYDERVLEPNPADGNPKSGILSSTSVADVQAEVKKDDPPSEQTETSEEAKQATANQ